MNKSSTMRTPALGLVPPGGEVTVVIEKAITETESPIVLTRQPGMLEIRAVYPNSVVIGNRTGLPIPYVLVVVPKIALKLAMVPWQRVAEVLGSPTGRSLIMERITQALFNAGRQLDDGGE